ncbi:MAG: type II toxin-antitoxin system RelE/ParE family toxin [Ginsengibacter sp.]
MNQNGVTVADNFLKRMDYRIEALSEQPRIGNISDQNKTVRSLLITKHNRMYYRIKENIIEVINLYDTRIHPKKNPYK